MKKIYTLVLPVFLLCFSFIAGNAQVSVGATGGTTGPTTYTTVKAAFDAINTGTHTGDITVTLTGNTNETASAVLSNSGSGGASYTSVLIKPAAGVTAHINGNVNGPVLAITGSNVTIDGSNDGTLSRDLTVSNADTSEAKIAAISVISSGTTQVTDVVIKNTIVNKGFVGIFLSDASAFTGGQFADITIENNRVQGSFFGIVAMAAVAAGNGSFNIVENDLSSTGTDAVYAYGIYVQGANSATISENTVGNFDATEDGDDIGIWLASGSSNTIINRNHVYNLGHTGGNGYAGHGIRVSTETANANVAVVNNMVANMYGDGWDFQSTQYGLDNPIGILLNSTQSGIFVLHNSVNLEGSTLDQSGALSAGIYLGAGTIATVRNNIVVNNLGLAGTSGYGSVGIFASTGASQLADADYNNYYVNPGGSGAKHVGQFGSTAYSSLASWKTATGKEGNSLNVQPVFVSATDLHLDPSNNSALDNKGQAITGITEDFDGDTRSTTTPDMGADEFISTATCTTPVITSQPAAVTACTGINATFTVVATGSNLTYQWKKDGTDIGGATAASYTINAVSAADAGNYSVVVSSGNCSVTSNGVILTISGPCTSLPAIDGDITSVLLMPNLVRESATLRIMSSKSAAMNWQVIDMSGTTVMRFVSRVNAGQNDLQVNVRSLRPGTYQLVGHTSKGSTQVVRMVKY